MAPQTIQIRGGNHPDFLDLDWSRPLPEWQHRRLLDLPKGISRHTVLFAGYEEGIYAIKELPLLPARREYEMLRLLEEMEGPSVRPVGLVVRDELDPHAEASACVITEYLMHSFSYRQLLQGPGFGTRRSQMLDGVAGLLVELHLLGAFWGDCSLSNVLYRYDAQAIEVTMVDAETAAVHPGGLTAGQRQEDLFIMIENVAGGMADIAAEAETDLDVADLALGEDIAARYEGLWDELAAAESIGPDERYRIRERMRRLNELGFEVSDVHMEGEDEGRVRFTLQAASRNFHRNRLRELTGIEASENQARQILSDLYYHTAGSEFSPSGKAVAAVQWRVGVFEPLMERITAFDDPVDPVQRFTDFLHHRYQMAVAAGHDIPNDEAFADWVAVGFSGYPVD